MDCVLDLLEHAWALREEEIGCLFFSGSSSFISPAKSFSSWPQHSTLAMLLHLTDLPDLNFAELQIEDCGGRIKTQKFTKCETSRVPDGGWVVHVPS